MQATTNVYVKDSRINRQKMPRCSKVMDSVNIPEELADLIRDTEEHKNYSGGLLAIVVICLLLGLIGLVTYLTMPDPGPADNLVPVYFSDIFKISSLVARFQYEWKEGHLVFRNSTGHFYSVRIGRNMTKASLILSRQHYVQGMSVSSDLTTWLIPVGSRQNEHYEEEHQYKLYQSSRSPYYRPITIGSDKISYLSSAVWGPRSKYMVVVYKANVYYSLNPLETASFICITCSMNQSKIFGRYLGYYKENIFKNMRPFWWNSNGQFLTFLSFSKEDDKNVEVEIFDSGSLYSEYRNISYAKAGSSPSPYKVDIHSFHIASQKLYSFSLYDHNQYKYHYVINVQWYNGSLLLVALLSTDQSKVTLLLCEVLREDCFKIFSKTSSRWINMEDFQTAAVDSDNGYIYVAMTVAGDTKSRRHIARIKVNMDRRRRTKTGGGDRVTNPLIWLNLARLNVTRLGALDLVSGDLFFLASGTNHSSVQLYRINLVSEEVSCQSCTFTRCYRNEAHFLDSSSIFVHRCLGPRPETHRLIHLHESSHWSLDLETNERLVTFLVNKSLPRVEYATIDLVLRHRQYRVQAKIFSPRHLNPSHVIQYPAVLILPDSPLHDMTNDDFEVGWVDYVTSFLQYVVIKVNVRGTIDNRPFLPMSPLWGSSNGQADLIVAAIRDLVTRRPYIDNSSLGVIGENYGGYLAGRLMAGDNKFPEFRCGVMVSPIVDMATYDSFFSERFLGPYTRSQTQYKNSRLQASKVLIKKELLLVHNEDQKGSLFEQVVRYIKSLVEEDVLFDLLLVYRAKTNDATPITNRWQHNRYGLKKITKFFVNCFNRSSVHYSVMENGTSFSV